MGRGSTVEFEVPRRHLILSDGSRSHGASAARPFERSEGLKDALKVWMTSFFSSSVIDDPFSTSSKSACRRLLHAPHSRTCVNIRLALRTQGVASTRGQFRLVSRRATLRPFSNRTSRDGGCKKLRTQPQPPAFVLYEPQSVITSGFLTPIRATDRVVVGRYAMLVLRSALICCGERFSAKRFSDWARRLAANNDGARRRSSTGRVKMARVATLMERRSHGSANQRPRRKPEARSGPSCRATRSSGAAV